jgi:hypothetical protein
MNPCGKHKTINIMHKNNKPSCSTKQFITLLGIQNMIHIQQHKNPSPKNTRQSLINLQKLFAFDIKKIVTTTNMCFKILNH